MFLDPPKPTAEETAIAPEDTQTAPSNPLNKVLLVVLLGIAAFAGWKYLGPGSAMAAGGWMTDWDKAVQTAKSSGKPAVVLFTADWCPPCQQFKKVTLADAGVQKYLRENYTPVIVDLSDEDGPNSQLASDYDVKTIPTLVMFGPGGQETARIPGVPTDVFMMWLRSGGKQPQLR